MSESVNKNIDFSKVYKCGKSYANRFLVMYILKNELTCNRLGMSVSKKVGNSVVRHRITRLIRESFRLNDGALKKGYDIVVVARAGAKGRNYSEISSAFMHLSGLHNIKEEMIIS